jgi:hypothetical protein
LQSRGRAACASGVRIFLRRAEYERPGPERATGRLPDGLFSISSLPMSWIEAELKRRTAERQEPSSTIPPEHSPSPRIRELWDRIERANEVLPAALRLSLDPTDAALGVWLRAANGALLGLAGGGIRYVWVEENLRKSNNFWITWDESRARFIVSYRIGKFPSSTIASHVFDERCIDRMIKCLVLGKFVKVSALRSGRLWRTGAMAILIFVSVAVAGALLFGSLKRGPTGKAWKQPTSVPARR